MCSVIITKINKYLINIIGEYLSPINVKGKFSEIISIKNPYNYFLRKCYFLQLKRTFPQNDYKIRDSKIKFNVSSVFEKRDQYIFKENEFIGYYINSYKHHIYFLPYLYY